MSNILSLSKARKAKARADKEVTAEQNRILFGRTKAEKNKAKAEKLLTEKHLDGHRLNEAPAPLPFKSKPSSDA